MKTLLMEKLIHEARSDLNISSLYTIERLLLEHALTTIWLKQPSKWVIDEIDQRPQWVVVKDISPMCQQAAIKRDASRPGLSLRLPAFNSLSNSWVFLIFGRHARDCSSSNGSMWKPDRFQGKFSDRNT